MSDGELRAAVRREVATDVAAGLGRRMGVPATGGGFRLAGPFQGSWDSDGDRDGDGDGRGVLLDGEFAAVQWAFVGDGNLEARGLTIVHLVDPADPSTWRHHRHIDWNHLGSQLG